MHSGMVLKNMSTIFKGVVVVLGALAICVALYLVFGNLSKPDGSKAAWQRRKDEWFYPGRQIQPVAADYPLWVVRSNIDPKTGAVKEHYDPKPFIAENCVPLADENCGKRLAAQGLILYLPIGSLIEVVKNEDSDSVMLPIRVLRMGKRVTTGAERARVWWLSDPFLTQTTGLPLIPD
jgi:hypothetical protein